MDYPVQEIVKISEIAFKSKLFPNMSVEAIAMIGIVAHDLDLPLSTALMGGINIIQGKPSLSARVMNLLIRRAGHSMIVEHKDDGCTIKGKRKDNGDEAVVSFTMADATAAGLTGKDNWKKHKADMLFSRALSRIARQLFPDCIEGAYVEGELDTQNGANDSNGAISGAIDVMPIEEEPLVNEHHLEIINGKCDLLPKELVEKILKAKGWESFAQMKVKQFNDCISYLDSEIRKSVEKEMKTKVDWVAE